MSDSGPAPEATLYTLKVAAAIAGPACLICILVMVLICIHQRRQLARMELNAELARLQEVVDCEIPPGHSIHDLIDMSTGWIASLMQYLAVLASTLSVLFL